MGKKFFLHFLVKILKLYFFIFESLNSFHIISLKIELFKRRRWYFWEYNLLLNCIIFSKLLGFFYFYIDLGMFVFFWSYLHKTKLSWSIINIIIINSTLNNEIFFFIHSLILIFINLFCCYQIINFPNFYFLTYPYCWLPHHFTKKTQKKNTKTIAISLNGL